MAADHHSRVRHHNQLALKNHLRVATVIQIDGGNRSDIRDDNYQCGEQATQAEEEYSMAKQEQIEWSIAQQVLRADMRRNSGFFDEEEETSSDNNNSAIARTLQSHANMADLVVLAGNTWAIKITRDGIHSNPDVSTDEGAKAMLAALAHLFESTRM